MYLNSIRNCALLFKLFLVFPFINYIVAKDFLATGPGLNPVDIVLPARYIFLHSNSSEPLDEKFLKVKIHGITENNLPCRVWTQTLNRGDGSFIVRYKVYETCYGFVLNFTHNGNSFKFPPFKSLRRHSDQPLSNGPIIFGGPVHPEECYCPKSTSFDEWLDDYECGNIPKQITDDLSRFPSVNFKNIHEKVVQRFNNSMSSSICHYVIKSNKVYRTCYGKHTDFKMFMDAILLSITRKVAVPDLEFYSNLGDWPLITKDSDFIFPVFSWCGSDDTTDIVMPTYDITESVLGSMGRVSLDMLSVQGNIEKTWKEKENKAFWRGRDSSKTRIKLIELSRKHPELINASLTNFFFFREAEKTHGPKVDHISFFKFFDYKYQLNLDGTVAAYRFPYLLAGDSLVFKEESKYYEHFYFGLKPWKHFIPFKSDLSNLIELLEWALENDTKAHKIAKAGREFALKNILPLNIICYLGHLLNEWSKRLESSVHVRKGMELVKQVTDDKICACENKNLKDEF